MQRMMRLRESSMVRRLRVLYVKFDRSLAASSGHSKHRDVGFSFLHICVCCYVLEEASHDLQHILVSLIVCGGTRESRNASQSID